MHIYLKGFHSFPVIYQDHDVARKIWLKFRTKDSRNVGNPRIILTQTFLRPKNSLMIAVNYSLAMAEQKDLV